MVLSRRYPLALALPAEVQSRRPSSRRSTPLSNPRRLTLSLRVPPLHSSVESTPLLIVHNSRRRRTRRNQLSPKIQDGRVW